MERYLLNALLARQRAFDKLNQSYRDETFVVKILLQVEEMLAKDIPIRVDVARKLEGHAPCAAEI